MSALNGTPTRVNASARTVLAIGSLSTSTPLQSKMTMGPSDAPATLVGMAVVRLYEQLQDNDTERRWYAKTIARGTRIYAQESGLTVNYAAHGSAAVSKASIEFFSDVFDTLLQQIVRHPALGCGGQNLLGCGHRSIGRGGAYVGERLGFGLDDLGLRHLGPPGDEIFHFALGLGGETFGLDLGAGNDGRRLGFGLAALALELGEQRLRLLAQPARFVELGFDARLSRIDRVEHLAMGAEIDEQPDKAKKGQSDPVFSFLQRLKHGRLSCCSCRRERRQRPARSASCRSGARRSP